jgi:hypothetical protein
MKLAWANSAGNSEAASSDDSQAATGTLSHKAFSTAFWVPFWGFAAAGGGVSMGLSPANVAVPIAIAVSAGAIGVTAVICGTILALHAPHAGRSSAQQKTAIDGDALDVVSRRG